MKSIPSDAHASFPATPRFALLVFFFYWHFIGEVAYLSAAKAVVVAWRKER